MFPGKWHKIPLLSRIIYGLNRAEYRFYKSKIFGVIYKNKPKILISVLLIILIFFLVLFFSEKDPQKLYNNGLRYFDREKYTNAKRSFSSILNYYPSVSIADDANYYYAICFFKEEKFQKTIELFQSLIERYKDSNWVPRLIITLDCAKRDSATFPVRVPPIYILSTTMAQRYGQIMPETD